MVTEEKARSWSQPKGKLVSRGVGGGEETYNLSDQLAREIGAETVMLGKATR